MSEVAKYAYNRYQRYQALAEFLDPKQAMSRAQLEIDGKVHHVEVRASGMTLGVIVVCKECPIGANYDEYEWGDENADVYYRGNSAETLREFLILHWTQP